MAARLSHALNVRIPIGLASSLREIAARKQITLSAYLRQMVARHLEQTGPDGRSRVAGPTSIGEEGAA